MRGKITAMVAAVAAAVGAAGAARWVRGRKEDHDLDLEVREPQRTAADQAATVARPAPVQRDPATSPVRPESASDAPASAAAPAVSPAVEGSATERADDLTAIKGLGKVKAAKLVAAGVTTYAQVAAWTDDDITEMGLASNTSPGQIKREDWVGQARALAEG